MEDSGYKRLELDLLPEEGTEPFIQARQFDSPRVWFPVEITNAPEPDKARDLEVFNQAENNVMRVKLSWNAGVFF